MSRQTLLALWLCLTLAVATWIWVLTHPDDCARYLRGDGSLPASQEIDAGHGTLTVPCTVWLPRQRPAVQAAVAVDGIAALVFGMSLWVDVQRAGARRRQMRS